MMNQTISISGGYSLKAVIASLGDKVLAKV